MPEVAFVFSLFMNKIPFDPKLAMALKITCATMLCLAILVIVQARNELHDVLMPVKVEPDAEQPDNISSDLIKRNWSPAVLAGGSTLFAGIAAISYKLTKIACSPSILARLAVFTVSVGVEYVLFWAGITLLSIFVLSLLAFLLLDSLIILSSTDACSYCRLAYALS